MSKVAMPFFTQLGGIQQNRPTHLIDPQHWLYQVGMQSREGGLSLMPRYVQPFTDTVNGLKSALVKPLSVGQTTVAFVLTNYGVYYLESFLDSWDATQIPFYGTGTTPYTVTYPTLAPLNFSEDRVASVRYEDIFYITQRYMTGGVWKVASNGVAILGEPDITLPLNSAAIQANPSGKYIATFFDHLFIANTVTSGVARPYRLRWSNLREFAAWTPTRKNEADYYDFIENQTDRLYGITGMHVLDERMIILTSNSVNLVRYVGLPKVVRVYTNLAKIGNDFPFGSISVHNTIWFMSERAMTFFAYNGQSAPRPVGREISELFFTDLTTDVRYRYKVYAYHNEREGEIVWAYCGRGIAWYGTVQAPTYPEALNSELVYNYRTNAWELRAAANGGVNEFFTESPVSLSKAVGNLSGQIQALNLTNENLSYQSTGVLNPFYIVGEKFYASETDFPSSTNYATGGPNRAMLETGDLDFGDPVAVKEVESMFIDCEFDDEKSKLQIEVAARYTLSEDLVWKTKTLTTTPGDLQEQRVTFPRLHGRFFRFRFTLLPVDSNLIPSWTWKGFAPFVYGLPEPMNYPEK